MNEKHRMSFNRSASAYRLARPAYPPEVYEILATRCGLGPLHIWSPTSAVPT